MRIREVTNHVQYIAGRHRISETLNGKLKDSPCLCYLPDDTRREIESLALEMYKAGAETLRDKIQEVCIESYDYNDTVIK